MRRTLAVKIYGTSVLIMTLLFALEAGGFFLVERASVLGELSADMMRLRERVSASLKQPVWILSFEQIRDIVELELRDESLRYVKVLDEKGRTLYAGMRDRDGVIGPYDASKIDAEETREHEYRSEIAFEDRVIGSVEIGATRAWTDRVLGETLVAVIVRGVSVVFVGLLFVVFMIRHNVVLPLSHLRSVVQRFADRDFYSRADDTGEDEIGDLSRAFNSMADTIQAYSKNLEQLVASRTNQLVESEKLAFLGSLVAGVAHEINTPVGIGVTAATHVAESTKAVKRDFESGAMSRSGLESYIRDVEETAEIIRQNLSRASDFVRSFKQIAVDQSSEERRLFDLREYVEETVFSLRPKLKKTPHSVEIECEEGILVYSYPGMFSQIVTNLIMNSLAHAFAPDRPGTMRIAASVQGESLVITYSDDGKGIPRENLAKVFLPFFTTGRERGGSGLGLYLIYNIVTKLGGTVKCASGDGRGVVFTIVLPRDSIQAGENRR